MKKIILIILSLCLIASVSAEYCYQETANDSHINDGSCSHIYTGSYAFAGTLYSPFPTPNGYWNYSYDGDYNTLTTAVSANFYVNYSVSPANDNSENIWQVKTYLRVADGLATYNFSIRNCSLTDNIFQGRIAHQATGKNYLYCMNNSNEWITLASGTSASTIMMSEESMWLYISPPQPTTYRIECYKNIGDTNVKTLSRTYKKKAQWDTVWKLLIGIFR